MNEFSEIISVWDKTEEEWLILRDRGLGGSDAGTVIGVNKYKSPYSLWAEKLGLVERQSAGDAAKWGHRLERVTAEAYAEDYNQAVVAWPVILVSKENPFMFANIDFLIVDPSDEFPAGQVTDWQTIEVPQNVRSILEVKTSGIASPGTAHQWSNNSIPESYALQTVHYGIVTGVTSIVFAALLPPMGLQVRYLEWDEELAENLIIAEQMFWDLVESGEAPAVDGSNATEATQQAMYPRHQEGKSFEGGDSLAALWQEFNAAKAEADMADAKRKALRAQVVQLVGDAEYATVNGATILTYKASKEVESLDTDRLKREAPEVFNQFKKVRPGARTLRASSR
jgi:putative phage-type endonuclease